MKTFDSRVRCYKNQNEIIEIYVLMLKGGNHVEAQYNGTSMIAFEFVDWSSRYRAIMLDKR